MPIYTIILIEVFMSIWPEDLKNIRNLLKAPLLEADEERELLSRWSEKQDKKALEKIISSHVRMVVSMAHKSRSYNCSVTDLVQEGIAGLVEAANRFDSSKDVRFSVYGRIWAKLYMRNYVFNNWSLVKISGKVEHRNLFFNWNRLRSTSSLASDNVTKEEEDHILSELDVKEKDITYLAQRLSGPDISIDAPVSDSNQTTWAYCLSDDQAPQEDDLLKNFDYQAIRSNLNDALTILNPQEQTILKNHWLATPPQSLAEISKNMNMSKEGVRQIEKRAMRKLKPHLMHYAQSIQSFLDK